MNSSRWEAGMAILALAVIPALVLEERATSESLRRLATTLNWVIWLAFCVDFAVKVVPAKNRALAVRRAWFDVALIVLTPPFLVPTELQGFRALRLLRLLRVAAVAVFGLRRSRRALGHRKLHYVGLFAAVTIVLGAVGVFLVEDRSRFPSFIDAVWWAIVTATTVGYGDLSPATNEGRLIAVILMLSGIGVIAVLTGTIASLFFEQNTEDSVERRMERLEAKLDRILAVVDRQLP